MLITLTKLPYSEDSLVPYISEKTIQFHYGKHHASYVEKLNGLIAETDLANQDLENIIKKTANDKSKSAIFNNAAQVWNHSFYWQCMKPNGGGKPSGKIQEKIDADFGSYENFIKEFTIAALGQFGSGWAWVVLDEGKLKVIKTSNADTPIVHGLKPLLTMDVWEHAYYLDYQNKRAAYVDVFIKNLINWDYVELRLA
jgi:Fe-Mn family superoxide dismutase